MASIPFSAQPSPLPLLTDVVLSLCEVPMQVFQQGLDFLIHLAQGFVVPPERTQQG